MHRLSGAPFRTRQHPWIWQRRAGMLSAFLFWAAMLGAALLSAPRHANAQQNSQGTTEYSSAELGMQIRWPEELVRIPERESAAQGTLLVLRHSVHQFPTANLIRVPGSFDISRASEVVADSYRSVGLTDARVLHTEILPQGWAQLEVSYRGAAGPSISYVLVVPRGESHAVLTMVTPLDGSDEALPTWNAIVASVQTTESQATSVDDGVAQSFPPAWVVVLGLIVLTGAITMAWHRRIRRPPPGTQA